MKTTVFGVGYVGLVQAAMLAKLGHEVVCVDIDKVKIDKLCRLEIPIYEPGLKEIVVSTVTEGLLKFTSDPKVGCDEPDVIFVAVGTPQSSTGAADLSYVESAIQSIADNITKDCVVAIKSTVPVGTVDFMQRVLSEILDSRPDKRISVSTVSNPEFLREGNAVYDALNPERVVIGSNCPKATSIIKDLYSDLPKSTRYIVMSRRSAELAKYASNAMLAARISLVNEIAEIASKLCADYEEVKLCIGADSRIGPQFISAGLGYGGSCFPKDVSALVNTAKQYGAEVAILKAIQNRNERQKNLFFEAITSHFGNSIKCKIIGVWGLTFKPNTNDTRESPSLKLVEMLVDLGCTIKVYDPQFDPDMFPAHLKIPNVEVMMSMYEVMSGSNALVIATDWQEFSKVDLKMVAENMLEPIVFDGRNIFSLDDVTKSGLVYYSIGRQPRFPTHPSNYCVDQISGALI